MIFFGSDYDKLSDIVRIAFEGKNKLYFNERDGLIYDLLSQAQDILKERCSSFTEIEKDQYNAISNNLKDLFDNWNCLNYPLDFSMVATILLDKGCDPKICLAGPFTMIFNGKELELDFLKTKFYKDVNDPNIVHFESLFPNYKAFPELYKITADDLRHLDKIESFYVYTGEDNSPLKLLDLEFFNYGSFKNRNDELIPYLDIDYSLEDELERE